MLSAEEYLERAVAGQLTAFDVYLLRLARAMVFGCAAALAAAIQVHATLGAGRTGALVFLLSLPNRGAWLATLVLAWLAILCFVPPELANQIGAWVKSMRSW
jgi:hypothetical protein